MVARITGGKNRYAPVNSRVHAALGFLVGRAERWSGAFTIGALKGYFGPDKFHCKGVPIDLLVGGGMTFAAGLLEVFTRGRSALAPHLVGLAGDPGMMSWWNAMGTAWGGKKAGRRTFVLDRGAPAPKELPAGMHEVLGASLPSGAGAFLSGDEVRERLKPRR